MGPILVDLSSLHGFSKLPFFGTFYVLSGRNNQGLLHSKRNSNYSHNLLGVFGISVNWVIWLNFGNLEILSNFGILIILPKNVIIMIGLTKYVQILRGLALYFLITCNTGRTSLIMNKRSKLVSACSQISSFWFWFGISNYDFNFQILILNCECRWWISNFDFEFWNLR